MGLETAVALASLGMSAYQGFKGAQAEASANQAAQNAANEAARIAEADKFKTLQVPTLGLELAQQNIQADQANQLRALQEAGGASGVLGGLTALNQQSRAQDLQLAAQGNQMQFQRDQMLAQNAQQIEQGRMQREFAMNQAKLAGAQAAAAEGRQNQNAAIQGGLTALSNLATIKAYKDVNMGKESTTPPPKTQSPPAAQQQAPAPPTYSSTNPNMVSNNNNNAIGAAGGATISAFPAASPDYNPFGGLSGLRAAQGGFDSQYIWDSGLNQWVQRGQTGDALNDMYQRR